MKQSGVKPFLLGITGGIASGKSQAAALLQGWGFIVIKADELGHQALEMPSVMARLDEIAGCPVVIDGLPQRELLARAVFEDSSRLLALEKLCHPLMMEKLEEIIERQRTAGLSLLVLEVALPQRTGFARLLNGVIHLEASCALRMERLMTRAKMSQALARARFAVEEGRLCEGISPSWLIVNEGSREELEEKLENIMGELKAIFLARGLLWPGFSDMDGGHGKKTW